MENFFQYFLVAIDLIEFFESSRYLTPRLDLLDTYVVVEDVGEKKNHLELFLVSMYSNLENLNPLPSYLKGR